MQKEQLIPMAKFAYIFGMLPHPVTVGNEDLIGLID